MPGPLPKTLGPPLRSCVPQRDPNPKGPTCPPYTLSPVAPTWRPRHLGEHRLQFPVLHRHSRGRRGLRGQGVPAPATRSDQINHGRRGSRPSAVSPGGEEAPSHPGFAPPHSSCCPQGAGMFPAQGTAPQRTGSQETPSTGSPFPGDAVAWGEMLYCLGRGLGGWGDRQGSERGQGPGGGTRGQLWG